MQLSSGRCAQCNDSFSTESKRIVSNAENRVVSKATKASAQFLAAMHAQGKTGAAMPRVFDRFWEEIGGEDEFGRMMGVEFKKSLGDGLTPDEAEVYSPSPKLRKEWFELVARHASKNDEGRAVDVGSLEEADLDVILADVARKAITEDPDIRRVALWAAIKEDRKFRQMVFKECVKEDPSLLNPILSDYGLVTLEGRVEEKSEIDNKSIDEDAESHWNPEEDEYRG